MIRQNKRIFDKFKHLIIITHLKVCCAISNYLNYMHITVEDKKIKNISSTEAVQKQRGGGPLMKLQAQMGESKFKERIPPQLNLFYCSWKYSIRIMIRDLKKKIL